MIDFLYRTAVNHLLTKLTSLSALPSPYSG